MSALPVVAKYPSVAAREELGGQERLAWKVWRLARTPCASSQEDLMAAITGPRFRELSRDESHEITGRAARR
jgi:hypothetical protein